MSSVLCAAGLAAAADAPAPALLTRTALWGDASFRHAGDITCVRPLSDGKRALTAARDGTARLWDLATGRELRRFHPPKGDDVWDVALLPGEREILTCGEDENVTRWDLETGRALMTYAHAGTVFRLAVGPGGTNFAACDTKKGITLWNTADAQELNRFAGHAESVYSVALSADGRTLWSGSEDKTVRWWNTASGESLRTITPGAGDVFTIALSPDGSNLLACAGDKTLRVLDADTGGTRWSASFADAPHTAGWSPDGRRIAVSAGKGMTYLLDAATGAHTAEIDGGAGTQWGVAFSPDGRAVFHGMGNLLARVDAIAGVRVFPAPGQPAPLTTVEALGWLPKPGRVALLDGGRALRQLDPAKGLAPAPADAEPEDEDAKTTPSALAVSPDGALVAVGNREGLLTLLDAATGQELRQWRGDSSAVEHLAFDPAGRLLLAACDRGPLSVYTTADGALERVLSPETSEEDTDGGFNRNFIVARRSSSTEVQALAVSADGRRASAVTSDHRLTVWDLASGRAIESQKLESEGACACAFLPGPSPTLLAAVGPRLHAWPSAPASAKPAVPADVRRLIGQLGAERFADREDAARKLVALGEPVLDAIGDLSAYDDPEVRERLQEVCATVSKSLTHDRGRVDLALGKTCVALLAWPDGRRWVAAVGTDAEAELVLGEFAGGALRILERVVDGHGPRALAFGPGPGTFLSGNRDGTVSVYTLADEQRESTQAGATK